MEVDKNSLQCHRSFDWLNLWIFDSSDICERKHFRSTLEATTTTTNKTAKKNKLSLMKQNICVYNNNHDRYSYKYIRTHILLLFTKHLDDAFDKQKTFYRYRSTSHFIVFHVLLLLLVVNTLVPVPHTELQLLFFPIPTSIVFFGVVIMCPTSLSLLRFFPNEPGSKPHWGDRMGNVWMVYIYIWYPHSRTNNNDLLPSSFGTTSTAAVV